MLNRTIKILLIEDNDPDADLVIETLNDCTDPAFDVVRVSNLKDALLRISNQTHDVILLDLSLPDSHGVDTLTEFLKTAPHIAVVVLTGNDDPSFGIHAVKLGAQDYLVKGQMDVSLMSRVLLYAIERKDNELERAAALQREYAARDQAEKAVAIRDEFLSVASHELKSPLTALKIQIELLKKVMATIELPEDVKCQCFRVIRGTEYDINRVIQLVYTLLDFSQLQTGRLQLEYSAFEFSELVKSSIARLEREIESSHCSVEVHSQKPIFGEWDRFRIEQVLINLLTNATKYAPGKPIEVTLNQDDSHILIRVQDHGVGIAPENLNRIFNRFERALDSTQKKVTGLGLGLYIVRQIVDAHGGEIHVESELGRGSIFQVTLPLKPKSNHSALDHPPASVRP